jgi:hypothetical protein
LFVVARLPARVHRQPLPLPSQVDCCLFYPSRGRGGSGGIICPSYSADSSNSQSVLISPLPPHRRRWQRSRHGCRPHVGVRPHPDVQPSSLTCCATVYIVLMQN